MVSATEKLFFLLLMGLAKYGGEATRYIQRKPVKILQVAGDTIKCVDINEQPSLHHPLLKNHKVQMKPTAFPVGLGESFDTSSSVESTNDTEEEICPTGSVPIYTSFGGESANTAQGNMPVVNSLGKSHLAMLRITSDHGWINRGVTGDVAVFNIGVEHNQSTMSYVLIESGPPDKLNQIAMGEMASLPVFGNVRARLFVFWTVDGGNKTGCYNYQCRGYVQVHRSLAPGSPLLSFAVYGGPPRDHRFTIFQDQQTGNWWVSTYLSNTLMGYFPKELVPSIASTRGNGVAWGANAISREDGASPAMGSGHKPDGNITHSAFFRHVSHVNENFIAQAPPKHSTTEDLDKSGCYGLDNHELGSPKGWDYTFFFGGPGGFCG